MLLPRFVDAMGALVTRYLLHTTWKCPRVCLCQNAEIVWRQKGTDLFNGNIFIALYIRILLFRIASRFIISFCFLFVFA